MWCNSEHHLTDFWCFLLFFTATGGTIPYHSLILQSSCQFGDLCFSWAVGLVSSQLYIATYWHQAHRLPISCVYRAPRIHLWVRRSLSCLYSKPTLRINGFLRDGRYGKTSSTSLAICTEWSISTKMRWEDRNEDAFNGLLQPFHICWGTESDRTWSCTV